MVAGAVGAASGLNRWLARCAASSDSAARAAAISSMDTLPLFQTLPCRRPRSNSRVTAMALDRRNTRPWLSWTRHSRSSTPGWRDKQKAKSCPPYAVKRPCGNRFVPPHAAVLEPQGTSGNESLSSAIVRRPLARARLQTSVWSNPDETIVVGPGPPGGVRRHGCLGRNGQPDRHLPVHSKLPGRHARHSHLRHAERGVREPHDGNG